MFVSLANGSEERAPLTTAGPETPPVAQHIMAATHDPSLQARCICLIVWRTALTKSASNHSGRGDTADCTTYHGSHTLSKPARHHTAGAGTLPSGPPAGQPASGCVTSAQDTTMRTFSYVAPASSAGWELSLPQKGLCPLPTP